MNPVLQNKPDRPPAASSVSWVFGLAGAAFLIGLMLVGLSITSETKTIRLTLIAEVARGRILYEGEGCIECHTRMVGREDRGMGPQASEASLISETSEMIGSNRLGPDIQNIAGKYPDDLLRIRLTNPQGLQPGTIMPNYQHLDKVDLDALIGYLQTPLSVSAKWETIRRENNIEFAVPDSVLETMLPYFDTKSNIFNPPIQGTPESQIAARGIFASRCAACHGLDGSGNGPVSWDKLADHGRRNRSVSPVPPSDFTSPAYRTYSPIMWHWRITDGMPGSGMPGWKDALSDNAVWLLVDYLQNFQFEHEEPVIGEQMPVSAVQSEQLINETDLQPSGQVNPSTVPGEAIGDQQGQNIH